MDLIGSSISVDGPKIKAMLLQEKKSSDATVERLFDKVICK
jgi:hypothetical protein